MPVIRIRSARILVTVVLALAEPVAVAGQVVTMVSGAGPGMASGSMPTGTAAISGTVVDGVTGRPIANAEVALTRPPGTPSGRAITSAQFTDAKGRFVFPDIGAADNYAISASAPGYMRGAYGAPAGSTPGTAVALADDVWFSKADISLYPTSTIEGRVLDEHGEAVVGAFVRVLRQVFVSGTSRMASTVAVTTDDRGRYRVAGLDPGRYFICVPFVRASAPVGADLRGEAAIDIDGATRLVVGRFALPTNGGASLVYPTSCYPGTSALADAVPIEVEFGINRDDVDVPLRPVQAWRVSGRVANVDIGPPAGLTLRLRGAADPDLGLGSEAATTLVGKDGSFVFVGVPTGAYVIEAGRSIGQFTYSNGATRPEALSLPGLPGANVTSMSSMSVPGMPRINVRTDTIGSAGAYWAVMPLEVNGDIPNVSVALRPAVKVSGRVLFEGVAAADVPSRPFVTTEAANGNPSGSRVRTMSSAQPVDPSSFTIEGVTPGEYVLKMPGNTWMVKSLVIGGREVGQAPISIDGTQDITGVVLTMTNQGATVTGTVRDALGSPGVASTVVIFPVDQEAWRGYGVTSSRIRSAQPSSTGIYKFTNLPPGDYLVAALDGTLQPALQDPAFLAATARTASRVSVAWSGTASQDLTLVKGR